MKIFNGVEEAKKLDEVISNFLASSKIPPKELSIIQIGNNESSNKYIKLKVRLCEKFGIKAHHYKFLEDKINNKDTIQKSVLDICSSSDVGSVIIQLPLPLGYEDLVNLIPVDKDIDLLSEKAKNNYYNSNFSIISPVIRSLLHFLMFWDSEFNYDTKNTKNFSSNYFEGKKALIIGQGSLVGQPATFMLKHLGFNTSVADEDTNLMDLDYNFDLVVLATGVPKLLKGDVLADKTAVIDFGSSVVNNKIVGDFDLNSKTDHLGLISPSPGGMGPLVVRYLIMNHLRI